MSEYLPKAVRDGLKAAQQQKADRKSRYRIHADGQIYKVHDQWSGGFSVRAEDVPNLRGLVDFYDGARHLYQCLIVTSEEEHGERRFEYKRATQAVDTAPLDFERSARAPVGLLPR